MALGLAILASLTIGIGEFWAGRTVRQLRSEELTSAFFLIGAIVMALIAPFVDGTWITRDMLLGIGSGVFNGLGLLFLYKAYAKSTLGLAAPIGAVIFTAIPVLFSFAVGDSTLGVFTVLGLLLGLLAIGLTSFRRSGGSASLPAIKLAVLAGITFGISLTLIGKTNVAAGLWPLVPQRLAGLVVTLIVARLTGPRFLPPATMFRRPTIVGVFGALGMLFYTAAAQRGDLGAVAVAGSQFAVVGVLLAYIFDDERLAWWQTIGVALSALGVGLIALG